MHSFTDGVARHGKSTNPTNKNKYPHRMQGSFLNSRGDSYVLFVIKGKDKNKPVGHAISAYVSSEDFVFFDPNFGEFWFPSHEKFQAWFKGYWPTSGYNRVLDGFYLLPYGKGI